MWSMYSCSILAAFGSNCASLAGVVVTAVSCRSHGASDMDITKPPDPPASSVIPIVEGLDSLFCPVVEDSVECFITASSPVCPDGWLDTTSDRLSVAQKQDIRNCFISDSMATYSGAFGKPVVWDTGANVFISPCKDDFITAIRPLSHTASIQGIGEGLNVVGSGTIRWFVHDDSGKRRMLEVEGYYCPSSSVRIFSPQCYHLRAFHKSAIKTSFTTSHEGAVWRWGTSASLTIPYHTQHRMPIATVYNTTDCASFDRMISSHSRFSAAATVDDLSSRSSNHNNNVLSESNGNITASQKSLLKWHFRLGHFHLHRVLKLMKAGRLGEFFSCREKDVRELKCSACCFGKAKRRTVPSSVSGSSPSFAPINSSNLPGSLVSFDQLQTRTPGRLTTGFVKDTKHQYTGATIFIDTATGSVKVVPQVSLTAPETVKSVRIFERWFESFGHKVLAWRTDNGTPMTSREFEVHLNNNHQKISFSGVGAKHQNGSAERAIGTLCAMARSMLIHAAIRWPDSADVSLWPFALSYAATIYNQIPRTDEVLSPLELLSGSKIGSNLLSQFHVWGCPVYVLDKRLQDGLKVPKWEPRSRRGVFLGMSEVHSSSVALVLNQTTSRVSPQFHLIFDDWFTTISSDDSPSNWSDLYEQRELFVFEDPSDLPPLSSTWNPPSTPRLPSILRPSTYMPSSSPSSSVPTLCSPSRNLTNEFSAEASPTPSLVPPVLLPPSTVDALASERASTEASVSPDTSVSFSEVFDSDSEGVNVSPSEQNEEALNRSVRTRAGRFVRKPARFTPSRYGLLSLATTWLTTMVAHSNPLCEFIHASERLGIDPLTSYVEEVHPLAFTSKLNVGNRDLYWHQAMNSSSTDKDGFLQAKDVELYSLAEKDTFTVIKKTDVPAGSQILPLTWIFRKKLYPDGSLRKYKGRLCVRGDLQESTSPEYAPVVQWSTIRLMLTLSLKLRLKTVQCDFDNAFVQASLPSPIYCQLPKGYKVPTDASGSTQHDYVWRLNKSLYGLREAPRLWFEHLSAGLIASGFQPSKQDPCLFYSKGVIALVYVDDVLFFARERESIDSSLSQLKTLGFKYTVEGDVTSFLGIQINTLDDGSLQVVQSGLIDSVLALTGLSDCNSVSIPAETAPLADHVDSPPRLEDWNYASAIGMLLFIAGNTHPEIAFAVNAAARFTQKPMLQHERAVKKICRYLKGCKNQGLIFRPSSNLTLDAYVDADFAGLYGSMDKQNPLSVKSRTGFVITLSDTPLLWVSKLQSEIALSTTEAEYIALSQCIRQLIPIRRLLDEIQTILSLEEFTSTAYSTIFEDNQGCVKLANGPKMNPRTKHIALKYHHFREYVKSGDIRVQHVRSEDQKADIFTKGLVKAKFEHLRNLLCLW